MDKLRATDAKRGWKTADSSPPRSTLLSTKASCQPEKPEISQVKTWESGLNPGVERALPRYLISNQRDATNGENPWNVADTGEVADHRCCQQNEGFWVSTKMEWLPSMTANHDSSSLPKSPAPTHCVMPLVLGITAVAAPR